jgi:two-component system response regulator BaeR
MHQKFASNVICTGEIAWEPAGMALVLVVEDDADIRQVMIDALESAGYEAEAVPDGRAALRRLRAGIAPLLILLDCNMAGMDGAGFRAEQMRDAAISEIPVLLLSGGADLSEQAVSMGVRYLGKPFRLSELIAAVDEICRLAR